MESTVLKKLTKVTRMANDRWVLMTQWNRGSNFDVVSDQGGPQWGREGILQRRNLWSKRQTFMLKDFMTFWKPSIRVNCCSCLEVWNCVTSLGVYPILLNRINGIHSNFESWFWKKAKSNSIPNVMNKWVIVKNEMLFKGKSLPNIWRSSSTNGITRSAEFKGQTMSGCINSGVFLKPASSPYIVISLGILKASKKDSARRWRVNTVSLLDYRWSTPQLRRMRSCEVKYWTDYHCGHRKLMARNRWGMKGEVLRPSNKVGPG